MAGQSAQQPCCFHGVQALNLSVQSRADKVKTESKCSLLHDMRMRHAIKRLTIFYCTSDFYLFPPEGFRKNIVAYTSGTEKSFFFFFSNKVTIKSQSFCKVNVTKALSVFFITFEGHCVLTVREACVIQP